MELIEIFEEVKINGYYRYNFDTEVSLDNIQSMNEFLNYHLDYNEEDLETYDGTQCIFQNENYEFKLVCDSGGRGDFYSHKIEFSKWEE